ncbi:MULTISPECIES: MarR family transcriptional regulator [unclassified Curtobacterium]|uniref:MarR family winged helix-turn-helix transcriptional regulator n=1 Tax=unclassified Curtobacterium TaxID=257496 RepID=UPI00104C9680|nr:MULTISPECIES: MarR family transcriptional regulator [unclassified Curtobacterium]NQW90479.1 MarR family transcriptional regulator [Curtobacterium sp. VKM Ac-2861]QSB22928.1 MarR family transcriptional regulator [Curtobacterium sp. 24E2]MBF4585506.1 MarR family transcriptional regulator [Curtobacterium sp. VKM Ac-2887]TCL77772.1 DNA-binding MarR family transcriptional regulator [Curtobacterium sp. PhB128]TCL94326.1 DNA-binding MarR family transcriptional regulator [Curtobacterium sp. PhB138]
MSPRSTDRTEVAARLAAAVGRINRRARTDSASLGYGIVSALATIQREGPLRPGDLSRIEVVTKPTMTRILTELEQRGFIAREADPRDGRAFMVSATDEGIAAVERARSDRTGIVAELIAELGESDVTAIAGALDALERVAQGDRTQEPHTF